VTARTALACAVVALALAGCGGGSQKGEVTKVVRQWTATMADQNGKAACSRMTTAARAEMASFAQAYTKVPPTTACAVNATRFTHKLSSIALRQMRDADVAQIRIDGATAVVHMEDGGPNELRLRREGDTWRIDQAFQKGWRLMGAPSFGMTGG
jgi:hypothetical protein